MVHVHISSKAFINGFYRDHVLTGPQRKEFYRMEKLVVPEALKEMKKLRPYLD